MIVQCQNTKWCRTSSVCLQLKSAAIMKLSVIGVFGGHVEYFCSPILKFMEYYLELNE